jgi:CRISPR-associated protein Csm4
LKSPLGTPLRSDTLAGQLLWGAAFLDGEGAVAELIEAFESESPPFVVSSGFPSGMLPMPVLPPLRREAGKQPHGIKRGMQAKDFKKLKWISIEAWRSCRDDLSARRLFDYWVQRPESFSNKGFEPVVEPHNTISRQTDTVLEGGLFFTESLVHPNTNELDLYVRTDDRERFERYMDFVAKHGYGRDTSIGRGHFEYRRTEDDVSDLFETSGDHGMTVSVFSAADLSGLRGYYRPFVKRGRVWGGLGGEIPFKKPVLAFEEGSLFSRMPRSQFVIRGIHADERIVQIMWPLSVACTIKEA